MIDGYFFEYLKDITISQGYAYMETNLIDLPGELIREIVLGPTTDLLDRAIISRTCKTLAAVIGGNKLRKQCICGRAAYFGYLDLIKWARTLGCHWDDYTCDSAARGG